MSQTATPPFRIPHLGFWDIPRPLDDYLVTDRLIQLQIAMDGGSTFLSLSDVSDMIDSAERVYSPLLTDGQIIDDHDR